MRTPTIILAVAVLLLGCDSQPDVAGDAVVPVASEQLEGAKLMATGGTTLIEKVMDDGGLPELQIDYTTDFLETLHDSIVFPLTIVTQDADGNELGRRVLANVDEAGEDDAVSASAIRSGAGLPTPEELAGLKAIRQRFDEMGEEERRFFIAVLRGVPK